MNLLKDKSPFIFFFTTYNQLLTQTLEKGFNTDLINLGSFSQASQHKELLLLLAREGVSNRGS